MSLRRVQLDLAVPEPLSPALEEQWDALLNHIRAFKRSSLKLNKGLANEENTTRADWHICGHGEGKECGPKVEI